MTSTREFWVEEKIVAVTWQHPLTAEELNACFWNLARMIGGKPYCVQVLFDLTQAKTIPSSAPLLAIHSGFLSRPNTGQVAIVTTDVIAEILAGIASRVTHHPVRFFPNPEAALDFLNAALHEPHH